MSSTTDNAKDRQFPLLVVRKNLAYNAQEVKIIALNVLQDGSY